jgi:hypothetical protein
VVVVDVVIAIGLLGPIIAGCALTARTLRRAAHATLLSRAIHDWARTRYALERDGRNRDVYTAASIFDALPSQRHIAQ